MHSFRPYLWAALTLNLLFLVFLGDSELHNSNSTSLSTAFLFFYILIECPHYFLTFTRTHFERDEFMRNKKFHVLGLISILLVCFVWNMIHTVSFDKVMIFITAWHMHAQNVGLINLCQYQVHVDKVTARRENRFATILLVLAWVTSTQLAFLPIDLAIIINFLIVMVVATAFKIRVRERNIYLVLSQLMLFWLFHPSLPAHSALMGAGIFHALQFIVFMFAYRQTRDFPIYKFLIVYAVGGGIGVLALNLDIVMWVVKGVAVYHAFAHVIMWDQVRSPEIDAVLNIQVFNKNPYLGAHERITPNRF